MKYCYYLILCLLYSCGQTSTNTTTTTPTTTAAAAAEETRSFVAQQAKAAPIIDGLGNDDCWKNAKWYPMDQDWIGQPWSKEDFSGRYQLSWDANYIYVLAEIEDDVIMDIHEDGLDRYWDDDCLEIFIDENRSKGNHQYNHSAFAYHIALDYKVADIGPDSLPHYYNDHITCKRTQQGNKSTWEVAMKIFNDQYKDDAKNNPRVTLTKDKSMGFAIAYCDNDNSKEREHFIGSTIVKGEEKNLGWIDAGVFGPLQLQ